MRLVDEVGETAASKELPQRDLVEDVAGLLRICDGDCELLMKSAATWLDTPPTENSDDRALHAAGFYMSLVMRGIGNLCGFIPTDALAFDQDLAAEGIRRGWR